MFGEFSVVNLKWQNKPLVQVEQYQNYTISYQGEEFSIGAQASPLSFYLSFFGFQTGAGEDFSTKAGENIADNGGGKTVNYIWIIIKNYK